VSPIKGTWELNIRGLVFRHRGCVIAPNNRVAETVTYNACRMTNWHCTGSAFVKHVSCPGVSVYEVPTSDG